MNMDNPESCDVLVVMEPRDFIAGQNTAERFYRDIMTIVSKAGLVGLLSFYEGTATRNHYPNAPILICHGLAASSLMREMKPQYSVVIGCEKKLGFNASLINEMDNCARSSHLQYATPNAHHYILTPSMSSSLAVHLKRAKNLIKQAVQPSNVPAVSMSKVANNHSPTMSYDQYPDYLDNRPMGQIVHDAVGDHYPAPTQGTQLWKALHAHATSISSGKEEDYHNSLTEIGHLVRAKKSIIANHSSAPGATGALGKINHALDLFGRHYSPIDAEHMSVKSHIPVVHHDQEKAASNSEKDLELWHAWKKDPSPDTLSPLMTHLAPLIHNETNKWTQTGIHKDVLINQARSYSYEAIQSFDPKKSQLNTHVINALKRLNRFAIENQNAVRAQEGKIFEYRKFMLEKNDLENLLGREATKEELQSHFKVGNKIGDFKPIIENYYGAHSEAGGSVVKQEYSHDNTALHLAYDAMTPKQQEIFKSSYGYNNSPVLSNAEIAKKWKISAPAVSKQKGAIDNIVREHIEATRSLLSAM